MWSVMPASTTTMNPDSQLVRHRRTESAGPQKRPAGSVRAHQRPSCECPGCRRQRPCYSRVEPHRQAMTSPRQEVRFAAHAVSMVSEAVEATGAAWLPIDSRGHTAGVIPYKVAQWQMKPDRARHLYLDHFEHLDPFRPDNQATSGLAVVTPTELGGSAAFSLSHFAAGYLRAVGFPHPAVMNLRRAGRMVAQIFVGRSAAAGDFSRRHIALLRQIHTFIQAALPAGEADQNERTENDLLTEAGLSKREGEVAGLAATGATNREIADTLTISVATVKSHLHHVFSKLDIKTRTELARIVHAQENLGLAGEKG